LERQLLPRVLRHTRGSQLQAARLLGISRNCLRNKLRALGLTIERAVCPPDEQGASMEGTSSC
jgi:two-component system nitrogen regulation response regulator GlnG